MELMPKIPRILEGSLLKQLHRGKSILLLGPRQVGKTTLISGLKAELSISLLDQTLRLQYEKDPDRLGREVDALSRQRRGKLPLVIIDEIQKVPPLMDVIQKQIDFKRAQFILTGSSARKLRRAQNVNLLPGRVIQLRLDPLTLLELKEPRLERLLLYGSLPAFFLTKGDENRELDLASYVETYLEEEVRSEALVRKIGEFARFLELSGIESGNILNSLKISQDLGVSAKTVSAYYEILEDCLIAERIDPITKSQTRKKLTRSSRYLIFDLGVRRLCANEGTKLIPARMGQLFEQWVGLEIIRTCRLMSPSAKLRFFRDPGGPEVDWVLEKEGQYIPFEAKWTESPNHSDAKNITTFLKEYPNASHAYVVCRCKQKQKLDKNITALPWRELASKLKEICG